jgi:DNA-binding IclR family transcriptional regulator
MIEDIFSSKTAVQIFDLLLDDPTGLYTRSKIAEGTAISKKTVQKLVMDLIEMGVLKVFQRSGNTEVLELDLSLPLVQALLNLDNEITKYYGTKV